MTKCLKKVQKRTKKGLIKVKYYFQKFSQKSLKKVNVPQKSTKKGLCQKQTQTTPCYHNKTPSRPVQNGQVIGHRPGPWDNFTKNISPWRPRGGQLTLKDD